MYEKIRIKKSSDKRINSGHLWIFSNELEEIPELQPGSVVDIFNSRNKSFGLAYFNPNSLISARLLKTNNEINTDFFIERIKKAIALRELIYPNTTSYRMVYGESDFLPGLIVDKFRNFLSMQIYSAGMELKKKSIIEALVKCNPQIKGIIEKSSSSYRIQEGLELFEGVVYGNIPEIVRMTENDIHYILSLQKSQKSGWFLDQKLNRKFISTISHNKTVLDVYTNQGGFSMNAAKGGAKFVEAVDSSLHAIEFAKSNAMLNGFHNIDFIMDDALRFLKEKLNQDKLYDIIILDPPAFAKSRKDIPLAKQGYSNINRLALKMLSKKGGILATSSCSGLITDETFLEIISNVAISEKVNLRLIYKGGQAPDHPILPAMPETKYLKFLVFEVSAI